MSATVPSDLTVLVLLHAPVHRAFRSTLNWNSNRFPPSSIFRNEMYLSLPAHKRDGGSRQGAMRDHDSQAVPHEIARDPVSRHGRKLVRQNLGTETDDVTG